MSNNLSILTRYHANELLQETSKEQIIFCRFGNEGATFLTSYSSNNNSEYF